MARSNRYKLLWSPDAENRQFFDLENDPLELANRLDDASLSEEITRHRAALENWALFESLAPTCLQMDAPTVLDETQTRERRESRDAQRAYSASEFEAYLKRR